MKRISELIQTQKLPSNEKNESTGRAVALSAEEESFLTSLQSPTIANSADQALIQVIKRGCLLMGINDNRLPMDAEYLLICQNLRTFHGRLKFKELYLAFEMAAALKLDFDPQPYQNFSVLYLNNLLAAYKRWSAQAYEQLRPGGDPADEREKPDYSYRIYDRKSANELRRDIQQGFENFKSGILSHYAYIPYEWWQVLVDDGYIEYDEDATVYENARVNALSADDKRKLRNGQQMVWLIFEMAVKMRKPALYVADF
jgi:hypothetical protein